MKFIERILIDEYQLRNPKDFSILNLKLVWLLKKNVRISEIIKILVEMKALSG